MKTRNRTTIILTFAVVAMAIFTFTATTNADLIGELEILDLDANGGMNPATGSAWQEGDNYRFAFVSSATRDATSTNIADYNAFVQGVANASSLNLGGATWNVIGSTQTVNANVNTSTNSGTGEAIFLLDGSSVFATDYNDLWNGVSVWLNIDENGNTVPGQSVFTGTTANGSAVTDRYFGTATISNNSLRVTTGRTDANNSSRWMQQYNTGSGSSLAFYGLSDPLSITAAAVPEPSTFALAALGLLGLGWFTRRRKH